MCSVKSKPRKHAEFILHATEITDGINVTSGQCFIQFILIKRV